MNNKHIAALAGVMHYVKAEEERNRLLQERLVGPYIMANRWSMYGRRAIMQLRYRTQRRISNHHMPLPFVKNSVLSRGRFPNRIKNLVITQDRLISQARIRRLPGMTENL